MSDNESDKDIVGAAAVVATEAAAGKPSDQSSDTAAASEPASSAKQEEPETQAKAEDKSASAKTEFSKGEAAAAKDSEPEGNISFLLTALLLPLVVVGGIYGYAAYKDSKPAAPQTAKTAAADKRLERAITAERAEVHEQAPTAVTPQVQPQQPAASAEHIATAPVPGVAVAPATAPVPDAAVAPATAPGAATSGEATHPAGPTWGYGTADGPAKWAALDPAYATCGSGQQQSPIDIPLDRGEPGPRFDYDYRATGGEISNSGHGVEVKPAPGNRLLVNGQPYELQQVHFHTPSEHLIGGRSFPMEAHLVHRNEAGQYAVVAVLFEQGGLNPVLERLPVPHAGAAALDTGATPLDLTQLLPASRGYFTFAGSLTTPPCSENVGWVVLSQPVKLPHGTIARFQQALQHNNRPVQPLNGRIVYSAN